MIIDDKHESPLGAKKLGHAVAAIRNLAAELAAFQSDAGTTTADEAVVVRTARHVTDEEEA